MSTSTPPNAAAMDREKRRVALSSVLAAVLLTAMKIVVGMATNSLGILSEAAHSGLDLAAAGVTLWAVRAAGKPADREHTYGHGKFENLSALFETLLLLLTCVWIVHEAVARLFFREDVVVEVTVWAFAVMVVSIMVDYSRSRALARVARKYNSQALEADALHFSTDIWSSSVVLVGLAGVVLAERLDAPWLEKADAAAALGVAAIVIWVSVQLGRKSVNDLLDRIPRDLRDRVGQAAGAVAGVVEVKQVRVRRSGPEVFADVTVAVDRSAALEGAHDVADRVEAAVREVAPAADVVVHVEPAPGGQEDLTTTVRLLAAREGLGAHGIRVYQERGRRSLELHVEVDQSLSLDEAHGQASRFESAVRESLPDVERIVTHIEPMGEAAATRRAEPVDQARILAAIDELVDTNPLAKRPHNVMIHMAGGEWTVSFHCTLDPATPITDAHACTEQLEKHLRRRVPNLGRVVIHVEPDSSGAEP
ncbi:MAG: cation-efflux pump [Pirellulales bacterium]|nr:cation-efflux pump [Pirellulales bacterium]